MKIRKAIVKWFTKNREIVRKKQTGQPFGFSEHTLGRLARRDLEEQAAEDLRRRQSNFAHLRSAVAGY